MNRIPLPSNTSIGYVHLQVAGLDQSLAFYRDLLGFQKIGSSGFTVLLSSSGKPPAHVILTALPGARPKPPRTTGLFHIAIRLPERIALSQVFRHLLEGRWPVQGASDHGVSEALYLSDPDGNGLELYVDRPRQDWPWIGGQVAMVTEPLDLQALLAESDQNPWKGLHPATDIGHIHLQVSDLARAEAFYSGLLGLDITQRSYPGALFLSAGGYHHHLGLNVWAGHGAPPPPADAVGLFAYKVEIPDPSARQQVLERMEAAGLSVEEWSLDGQIAGAMLRDPDGIQVLL
jgi:catechol 2,3-dioxygenase